MRIVILVACTFLSFTSTAQTNLWNGGAGDGLWTSAANWSLGNVPLSAENARIGNGDSVNIPAGTNAVVASVTVVSGSTLDINASASLSIDGTADAFDLHGLYIAAGAVVTNLGTLSIQKTELDGIQIDGNSVLDNRGSLSVVDFRTDPVNYYYGIRLVSAGGPRFTNSGQVTIAINTFTVSTPALVAEISATGAVVENLTGGTIDISSSNSRISSGLDMLNGSFLNEGTFNVQDATTTDFWIRSNVTSFSNSGIMSLDGNNNYGFLAFSAIPSILNSGQINITGDKTTAGMSIQGTFVNSGIINSSGSSRIGISVNAGHSFQNNAAGTVAISNSSISNGIGIECDGAYTNLGTTTISNLTGASARGIFVGGTGVFQNDNQLTISGMGEYGIQAVGELTNTITGIMDIDQCVTGIYLFGSSAEFTNSNVVDISDISDTAIYMTSSSQLLNGASAALTITGNASMLYGLRGLATTTINNNGDITVSDATGVGISSFGDMTNAGTMDLTDTNRGIEVGNAFINTGLVNSPSMDNGSVVYIRSTGTATLGGTVQCTNIDGGSCLVNQGIADIEGSVTLSNSSNSEAIFNSATTTVTSTGSIVALNTTIETAIHNSISATLTNNGSISLTNVTGSPAIENRSDFINNNLITLDNTGFTDVQRGIYNHTGEDFTNSGSIIISNAETGINNRGNIFNNSSIQINDGQVGIQNVGDFDNNVGSSITTINQSIYGVSNGSTFTNDGLIDIRDNDSAGYSNGTGATTTNNASIIITNFKDAIRNSGTLNNESTGNITATGGNIGTSVHTIFNNGTLNIDGSLTIDGVSNGGIGILNWETVHILPTGMVFIENTDNTAVDNNGVLGLGSITIDGQLNVVMVPVANDLFWNRNAATLNGNGVLNVGLVDNDAFIRPGSSPGQLTINGDLDSSDPASTIVVEIDGNAGVGVDPMGHDQIVVFGTTTLADGTIQTLTNGFTPGDFDCYTVIDSGMLVGTFGSESQPDYLFNVLYNQGGSADVEVCGISVLEVELLSFEAEYDSIEKRSRIFWSSESETNHDFYDVQFSKDGISWQSVKRVIGLGDNSDYEATHQEPIPNAEGKLYYRLRLVDNSASESFSKIKVIDIPINQDVLIWPNPLKRGELLNVDGLNVESLIVFDSQGRVLATNLNDLSGQAMAVGVYYIRINDEIQKTIVVLP